MADATPLLPDDIARTRASLTNPPDNAPTRDPLAAGGIPPELGDSMLKNAEALTQRQDKYMRDEAAAYGKLPPVPTVENKKLSKIGPAPTNDIKGDALAWLGFATALGGIAGAMTKRSSMNALAAFGGALDGLQQGNQTKFENDFKTWEANAKATQENNKTEMDGYRNILERADLDHRQRADQLEMWATQNRNKFMIELARTARERGDFTIFTSALDSMGVQAQKGNSGLANILETRERAREVYQLRTMEEKQRQEDRLEYGREQEKLRQEDRLDLEKQRAAERKDLETQREKDREALAKATGRSGTEDEATLMGRVDMAISGNWKAATQGLRSGSPNATAFRNLFAEELRNRGVSTEQFNKAMADFTGAMTEAQGLGRYAGRAAVASNEVAMAIAPALQASDRIPRGKFVPWNELVNNFKKYESDPAYNDFVMRTLTLKSAYVRAMNPLSNATVQARKELDFDGALSLATSKEAYETQLRALYQETLLLERGVKAAQGQAPPAADPFVGRPNPLDQRAQPRGGGGRMRPALGAASVIPQGAIDMLRKDPSLRQQFDAKYGAGASDRALGAQ